MSASPQRGGDRLLDRRGRTAVAFTVLLAVMLAHEAEHVAQVAQKDVLMLSCPNECRGLLGHYFDLEWVHFAYNASILVALAVLAASLRIWRHAWRRASPLGWSALGGAVLLQTYHFVEHAEKLRQWLNNGHRSPTPGFLGLALGPPDGRNFSLIELHFVLNTAVLFPVFVAYFALGVHRRAWAERTPPRLAIAAAAAAGGLVATGVGFSAAPPTVRLTPGVHDGPLLLDRPQRLVGERGAVVRGGIVVTSDDVVVRDVTVQGGAIGIAVRDAKDVVIERVRVVGAGLDGIQARRSTVVIRDCVVRSSARYAQGIDISFAHGLGLSTVTRCDVRGGQEGILIDFAEAEVRANQVTGTTVRAITVKEMAMADATRNTVRDVRGTGLYCGDYSTCEFERNTVDGVRPNGSPSYTQRGIAIVSDYHAHAVLSGNRVAAVRRDVATFVDGTVAQR